MSCIYNKYIYVLLYNLEVFKCFTVCELVLIVIYQFVLNFILICKT